MQSRHTREHRNTRCTQERKDSHTCACSVAATEHGVSKGASSYRRRSQGTRQSLWYTWLQGMRRATSPPQSPPCTPRTWKNPQPLLPSLPLPPCSPPFSSPPFSPPPLLPSPFLPCLLLLLTLTAALCLSACRAPLSLPRPPSPGWRCLPQCSQSLRQVGSAWACALGLSLGQRLVRDLEGGREAMGCL